ncbi:recombinase family protein [Loktanella salsilacus]|uniref:recombinase family protein n=1 Tax=Loktanella salsilacus TaxID=195913 RepID=UPI003734E9D2
MWLSTTRLARREKVTSQTIRRWVEAGRYERFERTAGGHLRVWIDVDPDIVLYARVSSAKQASSTETQERLLRGRYPEARVVSDIASGFNFKRRGFISLLERALHGEPVRLVATTSDRITRSGFPLIRHIFELSGGGIELLEEDDQADPFDVRELVAFITSFCNSVHGKRAHQRHKKNQGLPEG